jgi:type II secretory pathway predicted ATPase ExeA
MLLRDRPLVRVSDVGYFVANMDAVRAAMHALEHGLNVVVTGAPGTGKTSFVAQLSRLLNSDEGLRARPAATYLVPAFELANSAALIAAVAEDISGPTTRRMPPAREKAFETLVGRLEETPSMRGRIVAETDRLTNDLLQALGPDGYLHERAPRGEGAAELDVVILVDGASRSVAAELFERYGSILEAVPARWVVAVNDPLGPGQNPSSRFFDHHVHLSTLTVADAIAMTASRLEVDEVTARQRIRDVAVETLTPRDLISMLRQSALQPSMPTQVPAGRRAEIEAQVHELGRPAAMLVAEMQARGGPVSASDELLLTRTGWGRSRASAVLNQLRREGFVTVSEEPSATGGRPRRVYELVEALRP